jgi:hypothetical protein
VTSHRHRLLLTDRDLDEYDEELIRQYSSASSLSMIDRMDLAPSWQVTIPAIALDHPFLRHGLLALAAMHLQHDSRAELRPLYSELAMRHQDRALQEYIPQIQAVTRRNCHALFAFSLILPPLRHATLTSQISSPDEKDDGNDTNSPRGFLAEMVNNFEYSMGPSVIFMCGSAATWIREGVLSPIITIRGSSDFDNIIPDLIEEARIGLGTLLNHVDSLAAPPQAEDTGHGRSKVAVYRRSIEMLSKSFPSTDAGRRHLDATIGWPYVIGSDFIRLLKQNDSMALVILGFYGVALHYFRSVWWLDGLGQRLVKAVSRVVDPEHVPLLQWPLAKVSPQGAWPAIEGHEWLNVVI